jgi:hypothetical protein
MVREEGRERGTEEKKRRREKGETGLLPRSLFFPVVAEVVVTLTGCTHSNVDFPCEDTKKSRVRVPPPLRRGPALARWFQAYNPSRS